MAIVKLNAKNGISVGSTPIDVIDNLGNVNIGVGTGTSFNSITGLTNTTPLANGVAAVGNETTVARGNHVHPTSTLDVLSNVTITSNTSGEILKWDGTNWINNTLAEAGIQPSGTYLTSESDTLSTVTSRGATTAVSTVSLTASTASSNTTTGALVVTGGVGIGGNLNIGGSTVITGDLTVNGTTTTINSTTIAVDDINVVLGDIASPTDITAEGGGITLKGATNKTLNWIGANTAWTSSENFNLLTGKTFKINGTDVLSGSTLGSGITTSSLTSVGTIATGTWQGSLVTGQYGGTGVANTGKTITIGGNFSTVGAFTTAITVTGNTTVTLPTTGTLATTGNLSQFSSTTSAQLAGIISDETGSGSLVFATSPTLVTPALGTPSSGTLTSCTGLPISTGVSGLGTNVATFLATPSSTNLASAITDETGSGSLVFATSPTLVTPVLGTPSSGTLTSCTGLPISTGVSGLGSNVATFLATPSSSNLASAITDETGSGSLVFATSPNLATPSFDTNTVITSGTATTTATTANQVLLTVSGLTYRTAKFIIQGIDSVGAKYHTVEILAVHNGTSASHTEYAEVKIGGSTGVFDVDYNLGGNTLRLLVTPTSSNSTVFKVTQILTKI